MGKSRKRCPPFRHRARAQAQGRANPLPLSRLCDRMKGGTLQGFTNLFTLAAGVGSSTSCFPAAVNNGDLRPVRHAAHRRQTGSRVPLSLGTASFPASLGAVAPPPFTRLPPARPPSFSQTARGNPSDANRGGKMEKSGHDAIPSCPHHLVITRNRHLRLLRPCAGTGNSGECGPT